MAPIPTGGKIKKPFAMPKKTKKPFAMPFRDAAGKVGITVPSDMTLEDAVRLGMSIKIVPKDQPLAPGDYRYNYKKDMPNDRR
jgi:hypothetical protein